MTYSISWIRTRTICVLMYINVFIAFPVQAVSEPTTSSNGLLVDMSDVSGKVFVLDVTKDGVVSHDLFGDSSVVWIALNDAGQAVCRLASHDAKTLTLVDFSNGTTTSLVVAVSTLGLSDLKGSLSPDGKRFCFRKVQSETAGIEILHLVDGRSETVFVTNGPVSPPSWAPNGDAIAYYYGNTNALVDDGFLVGVSEQTPSGWRHITVAPQSKRCHRSPSRERAPIWGPSGQELVFVARYQDAEKGPQTYLVSRDGTGLVWIAGFDSSPSRSSFLNAITFGEPEQGMFAYEPNGTPPRSVFSRKGLYSPLISHDGKLVAYSDFDGVIYIANADGTRTRKVMDTGRAVQSACFTWLFKFRIPDPQEIEVSP